MKTTAPDRLAVTVRPLLESDLPAADRIVRVAFGTFLGVPDPTTFRGDAAFVRPRWLADPSAVLAAEHAGKLIGSNFAANWGSFGFFGPLTVEPAPRIGIAASRNSFSGPPGYFPPLGQSPPGPVHLCAQPEAYRVVSEIWFLATRPRLHFHESNG